MSMLTAPECRALGRSVGDTMQLVSSPETAPDWREAVAARSAEPIGRRAGERAVAQAERIVAAAWSVWDAAGTGDFTLEQVAARARVSLRTIYRYFPSKDELLLAVYADRVHAGSTWLRDHIGSQPDPARRLELMVTGLFHASIDRGGVAFMAAMSGEVDRLGASTPVAVAAALEPLVAVFAEELDAAATAGFVEAVDARDAPLLLQVVMAGVGQHLRSGGSADGDADHLWCFCARAVGLRERG